VKLLPAVLFAGLALAAHAGERVRTIDAPVQTEVAFADAPAKAAAPLASDTQKAAPEADDGKPLVRLVGFQTDVAKRYSWVVPPFPFPPFIQWRKWYKDHEDAVHCALEWRDDKAQWWHGELRSTHFDTNAEQFRVGWGEFPGTAYDAYGIYIRPGRLSRDKDSQGRPMIITVDEKIEADYKLVEAEVRDYAAKDKRPGDVGTGGTGRENVGLGGPAYKPAQNSNTMVNYILKRAGVKHPAPDRAVGWDREPDFPYSSDADSFPTDLRP